MQTHDELEAQARKLGQQHGSSVASWVFDGNTDLDTYRRVIQGYEDGDPEIMDMQPSPFSGEWTPQSVLDDLGLDEQEADSGRYDFVLDAYEAAFSEEYWDVIVDTCQLHLTETT